MIDLKLSDKLINKSLEQYNITIQEIRRIHPECIIPVGIIKKKESFDYYYNFYKWKEEEDYKNWYSWALKEVLKDYTEEDLKLWEMLWGLKEDYLYKNTPV